MAAPMVLHPQRFSPVYPGLYSRLGGGRCVGNAAFEISIAGTVPIPPRTWHTVQVLFVRMPSILNSRVRLSEVMSSRVCNAAGATAVDGHRCALVPPTRRAVCYVYRLNCLRCAWQARTERGGASHRGWRQCGVGVRENGPSFHLPARPPPPLDTVVRPGRGPNPGPGPRPGGRRQCRFGVVGCSSSLLCELELCGSAFFRSVQRELVWLRRRDGSSVLWFTTVLY